MDFQAERPVRVTKTRRSLWSPSSYTEARIGSFQGELAPGRPAQFAVGWAFPGESPRVERSGLGNWPKRLGCAMRFRQVHSLARKPARGQSSSASLQAIERPRCGQRSQVDSPALAESA